MSDAVRVNAFGYRFREPDWPPKFCVDGGDATSAWMEICRNDDPMKRLVAWHSHMCA